MDRIHRDSHPADPNAVLGRLLRPAYALPAAVVIAALLLAFVIQPGGTPSHAGQDVRTTAIPAEPSATPTPLQPTPTPTVAPETLVTGVAGARATPEPSPTVDPALLEQPTQCGTLRETITALAVEQTISGISVKATRAAVYPIDYFACILMATGGSEAVSLAAAVRKQETAGMTHLVLVDLWVANSSRQFGQVNLRTALLAAAGQVFPAVATLGGRSEVVISSGQGRQLTIAVAVRNTVGETIGPMTLVIEPPLSAGTPVAGRYQLFLPTP
ncbi:hypothetical protein [Tepidiforma sp.]|uniref:hypothetical protein n=1 Tax=Tepidiforma sp. TaxID=2682230 RepID=UPI002ADD640F|nr:hypothetical protein [Tepidiforma sp.]